MKRTIRISQEELGLMLAKYSASATCVKRTTYEISMQYSKGKPGPPFLGMRVDIREVRGTDGNLLFPIEAEFADDDSFKAFAPTVMQKDPHS